MKYVKIDPPGTFCTHEAIRDALKKYPSHTFIDVGCGGGSISRVLCEAGMSGTGVDFSEKAIAIANDNLNDYIAQGQYQLHKGDLHELPDDFSKVDLALSYMVMEHVEDDLGFLKKMITQVKPGKNVIVGVPGRMDCWSIEDETVGHLRRYDKEDLQKTMEQAGLENIEIWSVAVPTANMLLRIGAWLVGRSDEMQKKNLSQREQTETSGIQEIPWKTVFPSWVKIILNRTTLWPLLAIQRLFYKSRYGVIMMGIGQVPAPPSQS